MRTLLMASSLTALTILGGCGPSPAPAEAPGNSSPIKAKPKCPDPSIKDPSNPCSPHYYEPVKGSFKGQKSF